MNVSLTNLHCKPVWLLWSLGRRQNTESELN
jgi:hypothetical protein